MVRALAFLISNTTDRAGARPERKGFVMELARKTILITGGTSGIGLALARELLARGNVVIVTGRNERALADARAALPGLHAVQSDVADAASVRALHERVTREFPRLDVLINNAGVMRKLNLHEAGDDLVALCEEIDTNLKGTVQMSVLFLAHLKQRPEAAILNVSSGLAYAPYPVAPVYGASKAAVHSFTESLRVQLKHTSVRVFELLPPAVDTPLNHAFVEELRGTPLLSPEQIVHEAMRGVERDTKEIRVGFAKVSRFLSRLAPGFMLRQLSKPVEAMLAAPKQLKA